MHEENGNVEFNRKGKMVRRYINMEDDSDAYDTSHYESMNKPLRSKYEQPRRTLAAMQKENQGKHFIAYPNGDPFSKPCKLLYSGRKHKTLGTICDEIARLQDTLNKDQGIPKIQAVSRLFKWPSGLEVVEASDLMEGDETELVYSDRQHLKRAIMKDIIEGGGSMGGRKSDNSRRSQKASPTFRASNGSMHSSNSPINIKVTSNTNRRNNCSVFVNPRQDFQAILDNITEMLEMDSPCVALYPVRQLKTRVDSMSRFKLLNLRQADEFIACGTEGPPVPDESQSPSRGRKNKNGMANGTTRQSNNYKDQKGRSYQRHNSNRRSQADEDDPSPTSRSPKRNGNTYRGDNNKEMNGRDERTGPYGKEKATPRRQEEQNGHARYNDNDEQDDDNRNGRRSDGNDGNDSHDNRSVSSRGSSPTGSVMNRRIGEMEETRSNLDKDVDF